MWRVEVYEGGGRKIARQLFEASAFQKKEVKTARTALDSAKLLRNTGKSSRKKIKRGKITSGAATSAGRKATRRGVRRPPHSGGEM